MKITETVKYRILFLSKGMRGSVNLTISLVYDFYYIVCECECVIIYVFFINVFDI